MPDTTQLDKIFAEAIRDNVIAPQIHRCLRDNNIPPVSDSDVIAAIKIGVNGTCRLFNALSITRPFNDDVSRLFTSQVIQHAFIAVLGKYIRGLQEHGAAALEAEKD